MVLNDTTIPATWGEYFDPQRSTLNPFNTKHKFFVYGMLPLHIVAVVTSLFNATDYDNITLYGRALSALFDVGTLILLFLFFSLFEKRLKIATSAKYIAGFLYAVCVLPIQQSHFFTVDSFLVFFSFASIFFVTKYHFERKNIHLLFGGILLGAAIGCKITALLILPLLGALIAVHADSPLTKNLFFNSIKKIPQFFFFVGIAYLALRFFDPHIFSESSFLSLKLHPTFIDNIRQLKSLTAYSKTPFPPSVQWLTKTPILFSLKNIALYGIGVWHSVLFIFGILSLYRKLNITVLMFSIWVFLYFLYQSSQFVQSMRYFYILYPFICGVSAIGLVSLIDEFKGKQKILIASMLLLLSSFWGLAFMNIYNRPHSRVQATEWINANIAEGSRFAEEHWDDNLPLRNGINSKYYVVEQMEVFAPDTDEKFSKIASILERSEYIIFTSNRGYGSIGPATENYPTMSRWYKDLFDGNKNFKLLKKIKSFPSISLGKYKFEIDTQNAEEAFSVYDHPVITIFKKQ